MNIDSGGTMLDQIMVGIIGMIVGVLSIIYARKLVRWFGTMATAEEKLGAGGTYTAVRLIGVFVTIVSFLYMTGLLATVIQNIFKALGF